MKNFENKTSFEYSIHKKCIDLTQCKQNAELIDSKSFNERLTEALIFIIIPLEVVNNIYFRSFLEEFTGKKKHQANHYRQNIIPNIYFKKSANYEKLKGEHFWPMINGAIDERKKIIM